jgi:hypothetical protein
LNCARIKLRKIEKVREVERRELFRSTPEPEAKGALDLNVAIMKALESHSVPNSPADRS